MNRPGDLVRLLPRPPSGGFRDRVEADCLPLWSDDVRQHVPVPVGSLAVVMGILPESWFARGGERTVATVLVCVPRVGPVVVNTYVDRLREAV